MTPGQARVLRLAVTLLVLHRVGLSGQTPAADWRALDRRTEELYGAGDLPQAITVAQAALDAARSPAEKGRSLDRLGFLLFTYGDVSKADTHLRESIRIRGEVFGVDSLEYAESANDLAMLLRDLNRIADAMPLARRTVDTRQRLLGADDPLLGEALNTLGTVQGRAGDYAGAVTTLERSLAIQETRPPAERATEEFGTLCVNLAGTYQRLGRYALAEASFVKGLATLRATPSVNHAAYAISLVAYAALKVELGDYLDGERLYVEAVPLVEHELSDAHPTVATLFNNRGYLYSLLGNLPAAEADYRRSLAIKERILGPDSLSAATTYRNLAQILSPRDREGSERLLAKSVAIFEKGPNTPPFEYANALVALARAQTSGGALEESRRTLMRALDVAGKGLGDRHPLYAATLRELGVRDAAAGDLATAGRRLREALALAEAAHGASHPDVAPFLTALADVDVRRHDYAAALPLYRRSIDIQDRFIDDALSIGSESLKAASLAALPDPIPALIALQSTAGEVPEARALAFEAVTRRKGRVLEQVWASRQRLRDGADATAQRQLAEWQALLECRTSLSVALGYRDLKPSVIGGCGLPGTDLQGRYERLLPLLRGRRTDEDAQQAVAAIAVLQERGDRLEAALNRDVVRPARVSRVSLADLRARLAGDELFIEFVSYVSADAGAPGRRYGAFVIDRGQLLEWRDLGAAAPTDVAIRDFLAAANDWSVSLSHHERGAATAAERTATDALRIVASRVWAPLRAITTAHPSVRRLRIAPDASLNLVPFDALRDGGAVLIDHYTIAYVPAGRDLTASDVAVRAQPAVVVVSPGTSSVAPGATAAGFRDGGLARLASAAAEAAEVRRMVPGAQLLTAADATEQRVKALHAPAILHIVGHGLVQGSGDCDTPSCATINLEPVARVMSLSAIVLEEAYGRGATSADDGMLTPLELQNIDLRGTEMLVLSQCQMANGVASVGEGVYGMRRAAALAGTRTFAAPLWNVDDAVQRRLMGHFYAALAAQRSRADAIRDAKLSIRRTPATRSFLYWAPVILSGAAGPLPPSLFAASR